MKKITIIFLVILFLFVCFSIVAQSDRIQIWPGKLWIEMQEWPSEEEDTEYPTIQVTNPQSQGINVSARIDYPRPTDLTGDYTNIPDLSWVKTTPEKLYLPPKSSGKFKVFIEVPEDEQSSHFNEKWLTLVTIYSYTGGSQGGFNFQIELGVKLFIKTPAGEVAEIQPIHILLFFFISLVIVYLAYSSIRKKKSSEAIFYFKKKKRGGSKF